MSAKPISRRSFLKQNLQAGATGLLLPGSVASCLAATPGSVKRQTWQLGCYTRPWAKHDYRVALDAIAEAGFKYAGLMTTNTESRLVITVATTPEQARDIGEQARQRGLRIVSVYGSAFGAKKSLQAGISGLTRLIDNCVACNGGNLLLGGTGDASVFDNYYKAVAACCDYAVQQGIGMTIKPHGGLNATGPQCRQIVERVGHAGFRIWYDPANIFYYSDGRLDPRTDAATVDGLVVGMSVKDYEHPKNVSLTPGDGKVDFKAVLDRLQRGGFNSGPLIVECLKMGSLQETLAEARNVRQFLQSLTAEG